ncbi:MAG: ATP phosphoribosyltransferase regulatory subunit [Rhodospirillaceae bacterium]|nr:ATP phosphoribosyltransferase regulatory subunit [Rhodospirillaceae bacterium]
MANPPNRALLPAGLQDVLAPDAAHEAAMVEHLLGTFATWGYQRVKPPLVEFEHSLLEGAGAAMSNETFRLMDPVSQSMIGIRADMTLQIARIAASRLKEDPRPLRLSYAGDVLRVRGSQLRPERQFVQVGGELIGAAGPAADTEVIAMAVRALRAIGLDHLSVDLTFPTLISSLYQALEIGGEQEERLRSALDSKDRNAVREALADASDAKRLFLALLEATGPAEAGLAILDNAALPQGPRKMVDHLVDVASRLRDAVPNLALTLDPVEYRGFEYHTGIGFTIYRNGTRGEIGAGGRYLAGSGFGERATEPATGFTLFLDTIIRSLRAPQAPPQVYAPYGMSLEAMEKLRADGTVVVAGLEPEDDPEADARHLGCQQIIKDGVPRNLAAEGSG